MGAGDEGSGEPPGDTAGLAIRSRPAILPMTLSRARALCAISRKRIGGAALSGAQRVTHLARRHGTSRKFVRVT